MSIWARTGSECTRTRRRSGTTCSQAGTGRSPKVSRAMRNGVVSSDFGLTSMMSNVETRKLGMSVLMPLTRKWPWLTICRAWRRVRAMPAR